MELLLFCSRHAFSLYPELDINHLIVAALPPTFYTVISNFCNLYCCGSLLKTFSKSLLSGCVMNRRNQFELC